MSKHFLLSDKNMKKVRYKPKMNYVTMHKNVQKDNVQKIELDSSSNEALATSYNELTELTTHLAHMKLKVSPNFHSKWKNRKHNKIMTDENRKQDSSNSSEATRDNNVHFVQVASTSQISSNSKSKVKSTKHHNVAQNSFVKEKKKSNRTRMVLTRNKLKVSSSSRNQINNDRLTRKSWRNKTRTRVMTSTSKSNMENISKEYCQSSKKVTKSNVTNPQKKIKKKIDYIPVSKMEKILKNQTSDNIQYVKGNLRVNPISSKFAYLHMEDRTERDLLIIGARDRNRALEGDLVVALIKPIQNWYTSPDGKIQKTGIVVCILEKVHSRKVVGCLKKENLILLLYPRDKRIPLIEILPESVPPLYYEQPNLYKNVMFFATIEYWENTCPIGRILSIVGKVGEMDAELQAIILGNDLDISPYDKGLLEGLPDSDYVLTDADIKDREDWRNECIFSIDPATAVDIDDAVSCKVLDNGNYEIGVHISDVTHYLEFGSPLDVEVSKRATTIYLPHKAYHMLPEQLCQICSLVAGKDRLAFSVIWEMTPDAEIVKYRFAKTIIRSCCQMSYDIAQAMIENPETVSWPEEFLNIKGNHTASLLSDIVNKLFKLSFHLRNKRFINGALRLDQPKLQIRIDAKVSKENGIPIPVDYYLQETKDSNSLIEEFMLLANMTVAAQLYTAIPETALLRIHREPYEHCLNLVSDTLQKFGIHLDTKTAGTLQASIYRYNPEYNPTAANNFMKYIMMVIINLCSKTMLRAEYVCASTISPSCDLRHYALNVSLYTHFTSPIRRYPDCIVHRLLYAVIDNKPLSKKWTATLCSNIAANCNVKKYSAKVAQDQSVCLFFAYMVGLTGSYETLAIVTSLKEDANIDVILCDTGIKVKANLKEIEHTATKRYTVMHSVPTFIINWKKPLIEQTINLFSMVHVRVEKITEQLRLKATLLPPSQ